MTWIKKSSKTWEGKIYMAGDINTAKQRIREMAYDTGMCVTITPTGYLYTGGEESGFIVGLIQYPRFEVAEDILLKNIVFLAECLAIRCCQKSFTIITPQETMYFQNDKHTK